MSRRLRQSEISAIGQLNWEHCERGTQILAPTGARKYGDLAPLVGLRINRPNKLFNVCFDKWCRSLENGKKFGTNLTSFANMLSLIHRNLYRGFVSAIWAEVLSWFTNGERRGTATE